MIAFSTSVAARSIKVSQTLHGRAGVFNGGEIPFCRRTRRDSIFQQGTEGTPYHKSTMKISEYVAERQLEALDSNSITRPLTIPSSLAAKFNATDSVEYYSNAERSRWVGVCRARNFFAASNPGVRVTTGTLDGKYPTLRSF